MWFKQTHKAPQMIKKGEALPGRSTAIFPGEKHAVFGEQLTRYDQQETRPEGVQKIIIGMGCFWGAERLFWRHEGVLNTAVGYCGGFTPNPTYEEVCSGLTGHSEVVQVYFDQRTELSALLKLFWENHDPTQGMRQGNDIGTQYRSVIYWDTPEQRRIVDNGSYGSTGDQPTYAGGKTSLAKVAEACGCENVIECKASETKDILETAIKSKKMTIIVSKCESGNIPVPVIDIDPAVIRYRFMKEVEARN